jgi:predicted ATP-dependent endonuclease of OLD family
MHLIKLWISDYKNLKDFTINFNQQTFYDIIIGKNGSGKSNLFEALIEIFEYLRDKSYIGYDFKLEYEINKNNYKIDCHSNNLSLNEIEIETVPRNILPNHIIVYYSGHNKRIADLVMSYENKYRKSIKSAEVKDLRFLFGIDDLHKSILLITILSMQSNNKIRQNLLSSLRMKDNYAELKITFKRPYYTDKPLESWFDNEYWSVKGYLKEFLESIEHNKSTATSLRDEGYFEKTERYYLFIKTEKLNQILTSHSLFDTFRFFDDLRVIDMLESIDLEIELNNGAIVNLKSFSDGEIQTILFNGLIEVFSETESLLLLDEPDAFLHPEWQTLLLEKLNSYSNGIAVKSNVLISSHCASTVVQSHHDKVKLFHEDGNVKCISIPKFVAVSKLSGGKYFLDSQTQVINILHQMKTEDKCVLIVEGPTDTIILENAWKKLKDREMPFIIYHAFGSSQVKSIVLDEKIYREVHIKPMFGLFDFDKAYNNWNDIKGDVIQNKPSIGITKKIFDKDVYVMLLPVPNNPIIKRQTVHSDGSDSTFGNDSRLTIELMFYGPKHLEKYYDKEECSGGGERVFFRGDKDSFAKKVIPSLPVEAFRVFEPLFDFIESKI